MLNLLLVGAGGAAGAVARYAIGVQSARLLGPGSPYGTLIVNMLGGLLMGALAALLAVRAGPDAERWRLLLGVGVLGGFTTFSAYSLEIARMIEARSYVTAAAYGVGSAVLSVTALFAGLLLVRRLFA